MLCRPTTVDDLESALDIDPHSFGDEVVGRSPAVAAYRTLVTTRRLLSVVVELPLRHGKSQIVGFGGTVFVSDAFCRQETANPRPGLNARIIASVADGTSVVSSHEEIRRANTFEGLTMAIMHALWIPTLSADQVSALERLMSQAFYQLARGYRLLRLVREAGSDRAIAHVMSQRVFATSFSFDSFHLANPDNRWNRDRALFVAEREDCLALPASVAAILFSYAEPTLPLHDADQELVLAALNGATDAELARTLDLKLPALKKRWASLFDRVRSSRPDLVPFPDGPTPESRGPQKRHRLLAYLRDHPEELRPRLLKTTRER